MLLGWHFVGSTLRDGRPVPPDGVWLRHDGPVIPCESGLHMSIDPFDALQYAPGATLCRVELVGEIIHHGYDKVVGRERRIIARIDAAHLLWRYAADLALSVADKWPMPPIVREYLETLDDSKRSAASQAASQAAWQMATWPAADAAWAATWSAAVLPAQAARESAARHVYHRGARESAARSRAARRLFNDRVNDAFVHLLNK